MTDVGAKPLQVMLVDSEADTVSIQEDNLKVISDILQKTGADAVSIVAIMGPWRSGKSFLLTLLMRYLRCLERAMNATTQDDDSPPPQHEQWRLEGPKQPLPEWVEKGGIGPAGNAKVLGEEGFRWDGGMRTCTEGIWFWSRPFVFPHEGRRIAVLLMDTQGAWDGQMSKQQSATVFGITSLLASRLIVNMQNNLTDDKIDATDFFTTFAQNACLGLNHVNRGGPPFGHIEFLVRDWPDYEDGFSFQDCHGMMAEHLETILHSKVPGRAETAARLKALYDSMSCTGLPHPGLAVRKSGFTGNFKDISNDFLHLLDDFARSFVWCKSLSEGIRPVGH